MVSLSHIYFWTHFPSVIIMFVSTRPPLDYSILSSLGDSFPFSCPPPPLHLCTLRQFCERVSFMLGRLFVLKINIHSLCKVCYFICNSFLNFQGFGLLNWSQALIQLLEVCNFFFFVCVCLRTSKLQLIAWGETGYLLITEHCSCSIQWPLTRWAGMMWMLSSTALFLKQLVGAV